MPAGVYPEPERVSELCYLEAVPKSFLCMPSQCRDSSPSSYSHLQLRDEPLYEKFCGLILPVMLKLFRNTDRQRVSQAERRAKDAQKQHRQHLQSMAFARGSGHIAAEGTTYESGAY